VVVFDEFELSGAHALGRSPVFLKLSATLPTATSNLVLRL